MQQPVDRQFYSIESPAVNKSHFSTPAVVERQKLVNYVADNVIGRDKTFCGPFGQRRAVYLDYIASGRALSFIEDYIQTEVLPEYGNTHTTTSVTSLQTTLFRHEARDIIRNAVNASEHDSIIFTGSGSTGAIHKLIHALNLKEPPVVFVGPYEHHSNLLPWKETGATVVSIRQTEKGLVDVLHLEQQLQAWQNSGSQLIGSFSAASNVTGILCDVDSISILLHKYGALAFWDYATAAPYVRLDMNPVVPGKDSGLVYKDAMFISPHKFVGGVSTPGVLVAKKRLFHNDVPDGCGGGTVFYVRREAHRYLREPEMREEGGTPNIVGAIRAGLVFQLKSAITPELIMQQERRLFKQAVDAWRDVPNLVILGNLEADRLPIFSFLMHNPMSGLFLHHNYISALLNDLFGIQARGGCACAGPYAMELLGLCEQKAAEIEELLAEDSRLDRVHLRRYMEYSHREILRPGFTRLNLPYFISEDQLDFVLQAVVMVAEHGWKLLPQYMFNPETGEWRHKEQQVFKERRWLGHISYASGHMEYSVPKVSPKAPLPQSFQDCLNAAKQLFNRVEKTRIKLADHTLMFDEAARPYRWFLLPSEASQILSGSAAVTPHSPSSLPFCPPELLERLRHMDQDGKNVDGKGVMGQTVCSENPLDSCAATRNCCDVDVKSEQDSVQGKSEMVTDKTETVCQTEMSCNAPLDSGSGISSEKRSLTENTGFSNSCGQTEDSLSSQKAVLDQSEHSEKKNASQERLRNNVDVESQNIVCGDSFPQTLQTVMERGYCENASASSEQGTVNEERVIRRVFPQTNPFPSPSPHTDLECSRSVDLGKDDTSVEGSGENSVIMNEEQALSSTQPVTVNVDSSGTCKMERITTQTNPLLAEAKPRKKTKRSSKGGNCVEKGSCETGKRQRNSARKEVESASRWVPPSKEIFKPTVKALEEFSMIGDGDRVLVCLSGGKDSLSLLHAMHQYQFYCRSKGISFDLGAVTVDPQTPSYDPSPLKDYLAALGVPYFYESQCIMETAMNLPYECASICSFCSRMKRGRIYAAARREGYNVLALGQHLDDLAESFIMSLFHNGSLRTMKAHYTVQEGDLRVTRPFVYVREKDLRNFAEKNKLPVIAENCPACFEAPKERHRTKQLLASQEILFPRLYSSILSAIKPVMAISRTSSAAASLLSAADSADDLDI